MEKIFKLSANKSNVKTEIFAGLTTFMTMAYIVALNPNILTNFGEGGTELWNGVFLATCIASAIACFCMAIIANKPFALAPGMGLNSFFALVVGNICAIAGVSYVESFQAALWIVLIEGIVFVILSLLRVREKIVEALPLSIRYGIGPAIGLMLMNIGFGSNAGIYTADGGPFFVMRDYFGALTPSAAKTTMTTGFGMMILTVVTMFVGLFVIIALAHRGISASVLLGMLVASIIYWCGEIVFFGINPFASFENASWLPNFGDMAATTLFKFNGSSLQVLGNVGWLTVVTLVVTFCIIDMFDTIGTLVGAASNGGFLNEDGTMPNMKEALLSDAIGTISGACTGTSTITTFIESTSGIALGGRTGLTALTTGVLFLACIFIAPVAAIIPAAATSSALIYVGILMIKGLAKIDLNEIDQAVPVAIMLLAMPFSGSIGHGIGLGLVSYTAISLLTGKAKKISVLTYVLTVIFLVKFFLVF